MGDLALCGFCRKFEFEDESGYGFCSRDDRERHCSDLCKWQDVSEYRKMPQFRDVLHEGKGLGLK